MQYALIVALLALVCVGALASLGRSSSSRLAASGQSLAASDGTDSGSTGGPGGAGGPAATTTTTVAGGGAGPGGGATTSTPSTTAAPATTSTTGVPTTTTAAAPATSAPPTTAAPATSSWSSSATADSATTWTANATATIRGTDGKPLTGVSAGVRVTIVQEFRTWDGKLQTRSWTTVVTLDNGVAAISTGNLTRGGSGEQIVAMSYAVTGIDYYWPASPAVRWDGTAPTVRVASP